MATHKLLAGLIRFVGWTVQTTKAAHAIQPTKKVIQPNAPQFFISKGRHHMYDFAREHTHISQPGARSGLLWFSELSRPRQKFVRMCQVVNYGYIEGLEIKDCDPVFDPPPLALVDVKLDSGEGFRHELELSDFMLRNEILRFVAWLDELKNGKIERVEIRGGIPRRIVVKACPTDALG